MNFRTCIMTHKHKLPLFADSGESEADEAPGDEGDLKIPRRLR